MAERGAQQTPTTAERGAQQTTTTATPGTERANDTTALTGKRKWDEEDLPHKRIRFEKDDTQFNQEELEEESTVRYALLCLSNDDAIAMATTTAATSTTTLTTTLTTTSTTSNATTVLQGTIHPLAFENEGQLKKSGGTTIGSRQWVDDTNGMSHIFVDNVLVSLVHARIRWIVMAQGHHECLISDGGRDFPSRSGTFVNGVQVPHSSFVRLSLGDIVTLGGGGGGGGSDGKSGGSRGKDDQDDPDNDRAYPTYKFIDLDIDFYMDAEKIRCDLSDILQLSKSAKRMSDDQCDQEHVKLFHQLMDT
jgi:pSer/pThr/pTyr-binding forkhead associated (FHA) protein